MKTIMRRSPPVTRAQALARVDPTMGKALFWQKKISLHLQGF